MTEEDERFGEGGEVRCALFLKPLCFLPVCSCSYSSTDEEESSPPSSHLTDDYRVKQALKYVKFK